jgi:hypothetical protein
MDRLKGRGHEREFIAYCEDTIADLRQNKRTYLDEDRLKSFEARLVKLRAS